MKEYIRHIIKDLFKDEVDVEKEWKRLLPALEEKKRTKITNKAMRKFFLQTLRYAAAVFLGIGVSFSILYIKKSDIGSVKGDYIISTDKGERSLLQLPDGTKVWINSCTTLEYTIDYGRLNRDVYLNGEAYFEVAKNKELPFVVKTNGVDVKALGTVFNISAYKEDSQLVTTLFEGRVAVQPILTEQKILLNPNQMAVYDKTKNLVEVKSYEKKSASEWKNGAISFKKMRLQDIARLLERNYNVVFLFENQEIKNLKLSGSFRNNEDLSVILQVLKTNTGMCYQAKKDTIIIK